MRKLQSDSSRFPLIMLALSLVCIPLPMHAEAAQPIVQGPAVTQRISPAKTALLREMLQVTGLRAKLQALFVARQDNIKGTALVTIGPVANLQPVLKPAADAYRERMAKLADTEIRWDRFEPLLLQSCDATFNEDDLRQIIAFYRSHAGQVMLSKAPQLTDEFMRQWNSLQEKLQPQVDEATDTFNKQREKLGRSNAKP